MSREPYRTRTHRKKRALLVALGLLAAIALAALASLIQNHLAERAAHNKPNPIVLTPQVLADAKQNYNSHCASCHGAHGDGKGDHAQSLWTAPTDFQNAARMSRRTDGDLYWVTTKGSWPMPAFEHRLSDLERWQLAAYIRTFATENTPPSGRESSILRPPGPQPLP